MLGLIMFEKLLVDRMICRTLRGRFRRLNWIPPRAELNQPCILVANHHGWHDGYVMYLATKQLGLEVVDWIAEFDAFPLFAAVGGMPFSPEKPAVRVATIRKTIRLLQSGEKNLILFGEGVLHRPPEVWPIGGSLELLCRKVPNVTVVPVAIRYELSTHERPECFVVFGQPMRASEATGDNVRRCLERMLSEMDLSSGVFELLAEGTPDVNERWDMRRIKNPERSR